jgi:AcrR family transcriptional regulator
MSALIFSLTMRRHAPYYYERDHITPMRVTAQTKTATRERIVAAAAKLFAKRGWDDTTTRDLALASEIATGTLFNYFQSKEAVAAELIGTALAKAQREFFDRERGQSLEEDIFSLVWGGLKSLRNFRHVLRPALDTILSPLARSSPGCAGDAIRAAHLEAVEQLILESGVPGPVPALTMQIYWTLFLGIAGYWAADDSPNQEDTLALLDQSIRLFTASLTNIERTKHERESE